MASLQVDYRKVEQTVETSFTQRKAAIGSPPIFLVSGLFLCPSLLPSSFLCCTLLSPWHFVFTTSPTNRDKWWWIETSETSRTISPSLFSLQLIISDNLVTDIKNLLTHVLIIKKYNPFIPQSPKSLLCSSIAENQFKVSYESQEKLLAAASL